MSRVNRRQHHKEERRSRRTEVQRELERYMETRVVEETVAAPPVNADRLFNPSQVRPKSENQYRYLQAIDDGDITFGLGPAGSGKTYLAVARAVEALQARDVRRIVLIRPCLGVGRTSGFLPGDLGAKVSPYLRPVMDELHTFYTSDQVRKLIAADAIELSSLEYARGRTFKHAFVILDEAQNATHDEMWAFLTRLGAGSKYVITGDVSRSPGGRLEQSDLPPYDQGALEHFAAHFADLPGIATVAMSKVDVVRHPLVRLMVERGRGA